MTSKPYHLLSKLNDFLRSRLSAEILRQRSWVEFCSCEAGHDHDPVSLAFQAFVYLFCANGHWDGCLDGLQAITAFLIDEVRVSPDAHAFEQLRDILRSGSIDEDALWDWFDTTFPAR